MAQETEITVDLDNLNLTNRDMIDFERTTGMTTKKAFAGDDPPWIAIVALGWVIGRKDDPTLTWDDMLDADIDKGALMQVAERMSENPTPPANGRAGKATSKK